MKKHILYIYHISLVLFAIFFTSNLLNAQVYAYSICKTEDLTHISIIKAKASEDPISIQSKELSLKTMSVNESESNLAVNGDFEMDPAIYGSWLVYANSDKGIATSLWDSQTYHGDCGHSVKIQGDSIEAYLFNSIEIEPGKPYLFSAWGKTQITSVDSELGAVIYTEQLDVNGEFISGTGILFTEVETTDWTEATFNFVADENAASIFMMLGLNGSGTVWYDDITLSIVPAPLTISGCICLEGINGFAGGVQVILVDQMGNELANCTTNELGEFSFNQTNQNTNLGPGVYGIIASKPLFLTKFSGYFSVDDSLEINCIELLTGDLNQDHIIDIYDMVTIARSIGKQSTCNNQYEWYPIADLNRDNEVSNTDLVIIAHNYRRISYKKK